MTDGRRLKIEDIEVNLELLKTLRDTSPYRIEDLKNILGLKYPASYTRREDGDVSFKPEELFLLSRLYDVPLETFFKENS
ncbi:hypothetical protein P8807_08375 [Bacillus subtilis]|uniref:hypothetical protein n=1 Tax=Bacillus subtilis group TaxID=653685 RepID=UPI00080C8545|nr:MULTISPECIES: hypothetical protein [Bacillus subtilis group]AVB12103.1 transcriptional regulator [Bacillus velezensis]AYK76581.1 XRE family transcriptional regulator [Bacillus subtilis subsp. subtilis]AYL03211.1 XRE family transcriptional regulator [Bacillus subtilis subsp. subtilis]MDK7656930.1 hypothetical protein [Bacillus subtilis]MDQ4711735.1 hypothetical protein [Bacillus subtilis]